MMRSILIVEDEPKLHEIIRATLADEPFTLTLCATLGASLRAMESARFDAFLVDLGLPDGDGIRFIEEARRAQPSSPSLVLTSIVVRHTVLAALRAGASGYLIKADLLEKLPAALNEVLSGGMPMSISAARYLLEHLQAEAPTEEEHRDEAPAPLTARERELLTLISKGLTYSECGELLGVSINTVRTHIRSIYEKLHAANKAEAVVLAIKEGWI